MTTGFSVEQLRAAASDAVRAPSLHNTQPWRFRLRDGGIELSVDPLRRLPATDPSGWGTRIACGAALFNLRLALAVAGTPTRVRLRPYPADPDVVARLVPDLPRRPTPAEQSLYTAIGRRFSNRAPFWPDPVPAEARWRLAEAARAEQCWLELVIGTSPVNALAEIARSAHRVLERDPAYVAERAEWIRGEPSPDGVPATAAGPRSEPQDLLPQRDFGGRHRTPGRDFEPEPLVAVLGAAGNTATDQVIAGQALQRVLLTATDAGLSVSLISQPIEVPGAREALRLSLGRFGTPQMVMRIGYGQPGSATPRRPVGEVLDLPVVPA
ncbi:nitroreductase [Micromonospora sp. DR5-3]|uniref:Acg family FMN-binding oxidoreductase n=1 Tax=unclassified Micromonospora TaxID=2617518 RepID=UPI0011D99E6A|nr:MULTISPECIES: nitroreductase [unclassified Micromonospora]MCW3818376.1 nitroreductase [Micromonospora sp. DR5-3]TYC20635.1 nitroreductase [Micromonospora sp. MP36]